MKNSRKILIKIVLLLLISTNFLVGSNNKVWASTDISYQMKSNVGITFLEDSNDSSNDSNVVDKDSDKKGDQGNGSKEVVEKKKGVLPSTGEHFSMVIGFIGLALCSFVLMLRKKYK
ncbi:TPA: LPXTG cell wall anchor domain-containing protein [Enterococcus faecalis]|nr:LPXTG cell wall anchor domain-containing protein [Enterococcus faecalis]EKK0901664.1 LPXTG cell wall anchor domain-containing protein [Enterococcus faecalis]EKQ3641862.1 LPXTG cell wall anchor domain-containing protein [Enterococcus faecalis]EMC0706695.1 LPXTG cell wall anchor domain-containing protein [Enterococcus faecalis]HBI1739176.1 LPXTG cell wall anchor domain-containing protein [Enterococcus faecalis]